MKLPGVGQAIVDAAKIRDYLLSFEHPVGRSKARFFARLGFSQEDWQELGRSVLELAGRADATLGAKNEFGQKYVVRGIIKGSSAESVGSFRAA
jgi:hypothetical protein